MNVETFANFIVQTFQRQPDLVIAAHRARTRKALWSAYAEASGTLALIALHRQQVAANIAPTALSSGNYIGLIQRLKETLRLLQRARWWLFFAG